MRAFFNLRAIPVAAGVLMFSYFIEWTQYLKLADYLQLGHHSLSRVLLGDYFSWTDMLCYTAGILAVMVFERTQIHWHKQDPRVPYCSITFKVIFFSVFAAMICSGLSFNFGSQCLDHVIRNHHPGGFGTVQG